MAPSILSSDPTTNQLTRETLSAQSNRMSEDAKTMDMKPHEELQYLDLIRNILRDGEHRPDRYEVESERHEPC